MSSLTKEQIRDHVLPELEKEIVELGAYFAATKGEEKACHEIFLQAKTECDKLADNMKNAKDEETKKDFTRQLIKCTERKLIFEHKHKQLADKSEDLFVHLAKLSWRKQQAINHMKYHTG